VRLLWLDLETTGLDPNKDQILEVAVILADLADPFTHKWKEEWVVNPPHPILADEFVRNMHTKNGLFEACKNSFFSIKSVEGELLRRVHVEADRENRTVLAGSTVHFDLGFLRVWMPELASRLSHRCYDVSAVKLFCQSLGMPKPPKVEAHRAMADVVESIDHGQKCAEWLGL
jgi:oligoribonuclease